MMDGSSRLDWKCGSHRGTLHWWNLDGFDLWCLGALGRRGDAGCRRVRVASSRSTLADDIEYTRAMRMRERERENERVASRGCAASMASHHCTIKCPQKSKRDMPPARSLAHM